MKPGDVYRILKPLTLPAIFYIRTRSSRRETAGRIDRYLKKDMLLTLRINGEDLKEMGLNPGKILGEVLNKVLQEKIDRGFKTKQDELKFARQCLTVYRSGEVYENRQGQPANQKAYR